MELIPQSDDPRLKGCGPSAANAKSEVAFPRMIISNLTAKQAFRSAPKRLLLLEDDSHFAEFLTEFLTMRGYRVTMVSDGTDGMVEIARNDFDHIVCDIIMPRLRGTLFYKAVQQTKPHLCNRFIFMTGHTFDLRIQAFISNVGALMLHKPFHINDLFRALGQNGPRPPETGFSTSD